MTFVDLEEGITGAVWTGTPGFLSSICRGSTEGLGGVHCVADAVPCTFVTFDDVEVDAVWTEAPGFLGSMCLGSTEGVGGVHFIAETV